MFKKLTDFRYTRSTKEAIGFYLAYLLVTAILSATFGGVLGMLFGEAVADMSYSLGTVIAVIASLALAFYVIKVKNLKAFKYVLLACFAGLLGLLGGGLFGLIPAAYLTTKKK